MSKTNSENNSNLNNINELIDKKTNRFNALNNDKELSVINSEGTEPNFNYNKKSENKITENTQINNREQKDLINHTRKISDNSETFSYKHLLARDKTSIDESEKIKENNNGLIYDTNKIRNFSLFGMESNSNFEDKQNKLSKLTHSRNHSDVDLKLDNPNKKSYLNYNSNRTNYNQRPSLTNNFDLNVDKIYGCLEDFQKNIEKDFLEIEDQIENLIEKDLKMLK